MSKRMEALIREHAGRANALVARADAENRELTTEEFSQVQAELGKCAEYKANLDKATSISDQLAGFAHIGHHDNPGPSAPGSKVDPRKFKTIGDAFVGSEGYHTLKAVQGGNFWSGRKVETGPLSMSGPNWLGVGHRNELVTGSSSELLGDAFGENDSAGVLVEPAGPFMLPATYARDLTVKDILSRVPVTTDTIDYVQVAEVTNRAAPVPEATDSASRHEEEGPEPPASGQHHLATNTGGYKPESQLLFREQREHVRTVAHTLPVTKKALADAPQVRVIINTFLRYGLEEKVEDLILAGDGEGENFLGLLDSSREQSAPGVLDGVQVYQSNEDLLAKARRAKTRSRLARGGRPTGFLMHPLTWEEYLLTRDAEDRFRAGGPFSDREPPLWGLPVVESEAVPEGLVVTGNFRQAVYYDRQQSTLAATDSHEDFFVRNLVMILAELRGGFGVLHPPSFVKFSIEPDGAGS